MIIADRHGAVAPDTRPRERLLEHGPATLRDVELVSLVLGSGVASRPVDQIAAEVVSLLDRSGGSPDRQALETIVGLGPAKSAMLCAAFELARRTICPRRVKIRVPSDVLVVVDRFADRKQECFLTVSLNGAHEVVATRIVTIGLVNRTMVHPREVFADLLTDRAAAVVLAHNHPSGCVDPSEEDREVTRRLVAAGQTIGIPVLDHVVFGANGYYSFLEHDAL